MSEAAPATTDNRPPIVKGKKVARMKRISIPKWDNDGFITLRLKVNTAPKISASGKCYLLNITQGESDVIMNLGGVDRNVRMSLILYCKIPATERRASLEQEALEAEQRGEPKLF